MRLKGRSALITGASQGLGFAIAEAFLREGANICICARDGAKLDDASRTLTAGLPKDDRPKILPIATDIADERQVKELIRCAIHGLSTIDILVNNAGVYGPKGCVEEVDSDAWVKAIHVNLIGPFYVLKHLLPHMKKNGYGKIINLSGGGATAPLPRISAYAAAKAGLVRLTETVAEELRGTGIDVNAIAPGALNTRLLDEVLAAGPEKVGTDFYARAVRQKGEGGAPLDKGAALAVYLASRESDGITGKLISAVWDPWSRFADYKADLAGSDIYTLRRILPKERGKNWEEPGA